MCGLFSLCKKKKRRSRNDKQRKGKRKEKDVDTTEKPYLADDLVTKRISNVDMERLVESPTGVDHNEWLATHAISFFDHLNLLYGAVSEYCNTNVCSSMSGPNNMQYLWVDSKGKKCKCAAPQYVDYVMLSTQSLLNDETVFPTKYGNTFPDTFEQTVRKVMTWLYHVQAHMYHAHYKEILNLCLHPHLNTFFLHFSLFSKKFSLIDEKESEVLDDLFDKLRLPPTTTTTTSTTSTNSPTGSPTSSSSVSVNEDSVNTCTVDKTLDDENKRVVEGSGSGGVMNSCRHSSTSSSASSTGITPQPNGQACTTATS